MRWLRLDARQLIVLLVANLAWPASGMEAVLKEVRELNRNGNFEHSVQRLREEMHTKAAAHGPIELAKLANAAGWTSFRAGDLITAEKELKRAIDLTDVDRSQPLRTKVLNNIGVLYFTTNRTDKAEAAFREASEHGSETANGFLSLIAAQRRAAEAQELVSQGAELRRQGDFNSAVTRYDKALELNPNDLKTLEFKGYAQFRQGNLGAARTTLERVASADLEHGYVALNLLKVYCAQDDEDAIRTLLESESEATAAPRLAELWERDGEFRRHCRSQPAIARSAVE